ncbi:MAG: hypothetical protein GY783_00470 [Gammaproteobacteria bacterium]|nr:hypothetical protein [Gammaproteobacteria bacterium]
MNDSQQNVKTENRSLTIRLLVLVALMFGFGFLLVPLYDVFCEITGFGGRTNATASVALEAPDLSHEVRVEFVTTVNSYAPLDFAADVDSTTVHPRKMYYATFTARNLSENDKVVQGDEPVLLVNRGWIERSREDLDTSMLDVPTTRITVRGRAGSLPRTGYKMGAAMDAASAQRFAMGAVLSGLLAWNYRKKRFQS